MNCNNKKIKQLLVKRKKQIGTEAKNFVEKKG